MTKKRSNRRAAGDASENWKKNLITVDFSFQMREEFGHWIGENEPDTLSKIEELTSDGVKISVSYSDYYGCYFVSGTFRDTAHKLSGKTITIRHSDFTKVIWLLVYCIEVLVEHDHPSIMGEMGDELNW